MPVERATHVLRLVYLHEEVAVQQHHSTRASFTIESRSQDAHPQPFFS